MDVAIHAVFFHHADDSIGDILDGGIVFGGEFQHLRAFFAVFGHFVVKIVRRLGGRYHGRFLVKNDDFQSSNHSRRACASRIYRCLKYEKCLILNARAVYIARQKNTQVMNSLGFDKDPKDTRPHALHAKL
ncbi:MAG TPA: hypothetical protein DIW20_00945 [Rhodospirillaceae bacterium]|nr:hypothetical protein [Rhodospirillaceae bacterium]